MPAGMLLEARCRRSSRDNARYQVSSNPLSLQQLNHQTKTPAGMLLKTRSHQRSARCFATNLGRSASCVMPSARYLTTRTCFLSSLVNCTPADELLKAHFGRCAAFASTSSDASGRWRWFGGWLWHIAPSRAFLTRPAGAPPNASTLSSTLSSQDLISLRSSSRCCFLCVARKTGESTAAQYNKTF